MKIEWRTCLRVGVSAFVLFLCVTYWSAFADFAGTLASAAMPLLVGCAAAYVLNILMGFYERHYFPGTKKSGLNRSRRPVCMLAAMVSLVLVVVLLIAFVVPELAASAELLVAQLPGAIDTLALWLDDSGILTEELIASLRSVDWKTKMGQLIPALTSGVGNAMEAAIGLVSSLFSGVVTVCLAAIFAIYLLSGKERLGRQADRLLRRYLPGGVYAKVMYVLSVLDDCFHRYIVGQCTEAVILGALCTLGMLLLRIPYATMTGAVIAFTALIPIAGAYIGAAVGAFMIMTVSPMKAIIFLVFLVVLQQVEGNLIYPRVVGSSMGLPAIWVLAAVTVGGGVMGIPGMLIGVPIAAAVYRLLREDVNGRQQPERLHCQE